MKTIFHCIVFVLMVTGCAEQTNVPAAPSAYERWRSYDLHDYTIEQVLSCYCVNGGQKMSVTVRADTVTTVIRLSDSTQILFPLSKQYLSIDSLFGIIHNAKTDSLVITYNSHFGYPDKLDINPQQHPYDGGALYETSHLQPRR